MPERVVSVKLQAKVDGFVSSMRSAKSSVDDLTKADIQKPAAAFSDLSNKAAIAGVAVAAGIGLAVKRFAEFDAAMSAVQASTGATGSELDALREAAVKMGAESVFSAREAAEGINELGKAGVATADILGGGLKGSLDLAAAGQIGVAQAAETTASALTQFGLKGDRAGDVADYLANGANKAQGGVGDLGAALSQTGLVAAATGLTLEETTAGLAAFASAGLIGSDAGTSFKTMLQRLSAPSGEAAAKMKELGISAYDANGNFVGLEAVSGQLRSGMERLDPATRNAAMATIFGADAVRAANILYAEGADGIAKWTEEVTVQGAAAETAAALTNNLKGDLERLGGAFDSILIQSGSGANEGLRTLTQGLTGLVEALGKVPGPVLLAAAGLASFALVLPKGVSMYREFTGALDSVGLSMEKISARGPKAAKGVEMAGKAAGVAGKAFLALAAAAAATELLGDDVSTVGVQKLTADLLAADDAVSVFSESVKANAADMGNIQGDLASFGDVLRATFDPNFLDSFTSKGDAALGAISLGMIDLTTTTDDAAARLGDLDGVLSGLVSSGNADQAATLFTEFAAAAAAQGISVDQLSSKLPMYGEALAGVTTAQAGAAAGATDVAGGFLTAADAAFEASGGTEAWAADLEALNSPMLTARDAARQFEQAVDDASDAVKENGETLDINTQKGRDNQAALDGVASAAISQISALQQNGASQGELQAKLDTSRDRLAAVAENFGMTKDEARTYAEQVLKIPAARSTTATFRTVGLDDLQRAGSYLASLRDRRITLTVGTVHVGNSKVNAGQFASGGPIYGPGSKTSDDVPIWASHGEFMQRAAAVDKYGTRFMHAVNSLRFPAELARGFAQGGSITPSYAPAMSAAPSWASQSGRSRGMATAGPSVARLHPDDISRLAAAIRSGASDGISGLAGRAMTHAPVGGY